MRLSISISSNAELFCEEGPDIRWGIPQTMRKPSSSFHSNASLFPNCYVPDISRQLFWAELLIKPRKKNTFLDSKELCWPGVGDLDYNNGVTPNYFYLPNSSPDLHHLCWPHQRIHCQLGKPSLSTVVFSSPTSVISTAPYHIVEPLSPLHLIS